MRLNRGGNLCQHTWSSELRMRLRYWEPAWADVSSAIRADFLCCSLSEAAQLFDAFA